MSRYLKCVLMTLVLIGLGMGAFCGTQPVIEDLQQVELEAKVSEERINAARALDSTGAILVDILQQTATPAGQSPAVPMGTANVPPWPSRIGGPRMVPLSALTTPPSGEYDLVGISPSGQTAQVLSLRVPASSVGDQEGTVVEFNFRAINPFAYGHDPANEAYDLPEAKFPSNDPDLASRSLIDPNGGSVAIVVRGVPFKDATDVHTTAIMPTTSTAWLGFMRDNGLNSGLFYLLAAARSGGPVALADIAGSEGDYQSVQINGTDFEAACDWSNSYFNGFPVFNGLGAYGFADLSNIDAAGNVVGGLGGFVFVFRPTAFAGMPVVIDPSKFPLTGQGDVKAPPLSGYDEIALSAFTGNTNHHTPIRKVDGPPGVHELSLAVYFWHTGNGPD